MIFKNRLVVLENSAHRHNYVPRIIIHTLVEPSEDGPKEVGAFARLETNGICQSIGRKADETQRQFENRIKYYPNFEKKHILKKS